jgi:hypothetical protein
VAFLGGGFRGRRAQRVGTHHDALAVDLQHEQVPGKACGRESLQVERLEVDRCPAREVFDLTLTQVLSAGPFDRVHRAFVGTSGALDGGQPPQSMGVLLDRQVQHRIGRVQVRLTGGTVGQPGDRDLTEEDRPQPTVVADLNPGPIGPAHAGDLKAGFTHRTQGNVVLE